MVDESSDNRSELGMPKAHTILSDVSNEPLSSRSRGTWPFVSHFIRFNRRTPSSSSGSPVDEAIRGMRDDPVARDGLRRGLSNDSCVTDYSPDGVLDGTEPLGNPHEAFKGQMAATAWWGRCWKFLVRTCRDLWITVTARWRHAFDMLRNGTKRQKADVQVELATAENAAKPISETTGKGWSCCRLKSDPTTHACSRASAADLRDLRLQEQSRQYTSFVKRNIRLRHWSILSLA